MLNENELKSVLEKLQSTKVSDGWFDGMVKCPNKNCITAQPKEPVRPRFRLVRTNPIILQCFYCGRYIDQDTVIAQLG